MIWRAALLVLALSCPAGADCPPAPDHSAEQARLSVQLRNAPDAGVARQIQNRLWQLWTQAPDATAQALLDRGMAMREGYDFAGSRTELDALVEYCPDYAEGYNQRAFSAFLAQDYGAALDDLETVLEMNPDHVPARAGLALTLMGLGRGEAAQRVLRDAVRRNPWLSERSLLTEPPGRDI